MKTRNRMISTVIAVVMVLSVFCIVTAQPVSAASKEKTYSSNDLYTEPYRKDKDGAYYIWADYGSGYGSGDDYDHRVLRCAKSVKSKGKVLAEYKKKQSITPTAVTNGETIYYAVLDCSKKAKKTILYKTTTNGKTPVKIKTFKGFCVLATFYKNKLYYVNNKEEKLYSYDVSNKRIKLETKKFRIGLSGERLNKESYWTLTCGHGKYVVRRELVPDPEMGTGRYTFGNNYLYNIVTKKQIRLPGTDSVVDGKNIYYSSREEVYKFFIKRCNLSGKNEKIIKTVQWVYEIGRKAAWVRDMKDDHFKKLTYKTKKLTSVYAPPQ